jgi:purine-binding chemotaxis protein CheW
MSITAESVAEADVQKNVAGKYLTFTLGTESYGIQVLKVREIIRLINITAVPQMPDYIKGVINLRGKIIPVLDLRRKLGMTDGQASEHNCIVVVHVTCGRAEKRSMGLIVDAVEEVVNIAATDIEETPDFGTHLDTDCLLGMAKIKGQVKSLLDIDRVVGYETAPAIQEALAN